MKLNQLIKKIEEYYPVDLAEEWDNVGLQIGDKFKEVKNILTVLEITPEVLEEALETEADLIVAHHPLILKNPLYNLDYNVGNNRIIKELIKNDIALYVMHTNVDIANNGMNDWLAEILGITNTSILSITKRKALSKVELEVAPEQMELIIDELITLGISKTKSNRQNLTMGPKVKRYQKNNSKDVTEIDVVIISFNANDEQLKEIKYRLDELKYKSSINTRLSIVELKYGSIPYGIGRVGFIKPIALENLASKIKSIFDTEDIRIVGSREKIVQKVGIIGGSGSSYIQEAKRKNCDVLITGDIGFHAAQEAAALGMGLIDAGHYIEIIFNDAIAAFLNVIDEEIIAIASEIDTNPFERI